MDLDGLDVALLERMRDQPRAGVLELSRALGVARATVQARVQRLEEGGVVTGYGPDVDVAAAGFGVRAYVTLEIAQGGLEQATADLAAVDELRDRGRERRERLLRAVGAQRRDGRPRGERTRAQGDGGHDDRACPQAPTTRSRRAELTQLTPPRGRGGVARLLHPGHVIRS